MTTALVPFTYEGQQVRTVTMDGAPWFVLADLCAVLGIANPSDIRKRIDPDALDQTEVIDSMGRRQSASVVNEAGMYEVVIRSDKPEAVTFRRWITGTVLPEIRKTGSFTAQSPAEQMAIGLIAAQQLLAVADERIKELEPKAEVADRLLNAEGDLSVADAAKSLTRAGVATGEARLFKVLDTQYHWIFRAPGDGRWRVYQRAIEQSLMSVIPMSHYHPKTGVLVLDPPQPRVTPKGLQRIMSDHGAA